MARLRSFRARAFGARVFIPVFGKPNEQHSGSSGPARRPVFKPSAYENDDDETIMLVLNAFTLILSANYGRK